jgi:hypothetical protein
LKILTAKCDIRCQVTRGRQPQWAATPLAGWLREQLAGRDKQSLIEELVKRGKSPGAASRAVLRWTFNGQPETAARLSRDYLVLLRDIFGEVPADGAATLDLAIQAHDFQRQIDALRLELQDAGVLPAHRGDAPTREQRQ